MATDKTVPVTDNLAANQYLRETWQKRIASGDSVLRQLSDAHKMHRDIRTSLEEAYSKRDPETTEAAHFMSLRRLGWKSIESAAQANDRAIEQAKAEAKAIEAALQSQLGLVENHRSGEIRSYLRSLSPQERDSILQQAAAEGDAATVASVIEAPAYLSGVSKERAASLKREYENRHGGDLPARLADIEKAIEINQQTGDDVLSFFERRLPSAREREIREAQASAREMKERLEVRGAGLV